MIRLRKAQPQDCRIIFRWRNHPKVRAHFFNADEIGFDEHRNWFEKSLRMENRILLIALENDQPVGVLRFDIADDAVAEIDIYVAAEKQGRGLGKEILREGEDWVRRNTEIRMLRAKVMQENGPSLGMFRNRGFAVKYLQFEKEI